MTDLIAVQKIAGWQKLKMLVLDSVSSPITKRVYNMARDEFMGWFQQAPRPGFTKATVSAWRVSLEDRGLGSSSIIIRMSAIRKLAAEAADTRVPSLLAVGLEDSGNLPPDSQSKRSSAIHSPHRQLSPLFPEFKTHSSEVPQRLPSSRCIENAPALRCRAFREIVRAGSFPIQH
jgi:hypothetical protein